jgi:hypothetical protein
MSVHPTQEQAALLRETLAQHTACYNAVAREGFTTQCSNGVELHKRTYYPLRAAIPRFARATGLRCPCACHQKRQECVDVGEIPLAGGPQSIGFSCQSSD